MSHVKHGILCRLTLSKTKERVQQLAKPLLWAILCFEGLPRREEEREMIEEEDCDDIEDDGP